MSFLDKINTLKQKVVVSISSKTEPSSVKTEDVGDNLNDSLDLLGETTTKSINVVLSDNKSLGKIKNGDVIPQGLTLPELLQLILVEKIDPIITAPTLASTISPSSLIQEVGVNSNVVLSSLFDRGSIFQSWDGISKPRTGIVNNYSFYKDNTLKSTQADANYIYANETVILGLQRYKVVVNYSEGIQPLDSEGNPFDFPIPAGSLEDVKAIEGVYAIYAKTNIISDYTKQPLYSMLNSSEIELDLVAESEISRQGFRLPLSWVTSKPLQKVLYFNPIANTFDPENKLSDFTTSTVPVNSVNYRQYEYNGPLRSNMKIKLIF